LGKGAFFFKFLEEEGGSRSVVDGRREGSEERVGPLWINPRSGQGAFDDFKKEINTYRKEKRRNIEGKISNCLPGKVSASVSWVTLQISKKKKKNSKEETEGEGGDREKRGRCCNLLGKLQYYLHIAPLGTNHEKCGDSI